MASDPISVKGSDAVFWARNGLRVFSELGERKGEEINGV